MGSEGASVDAERNKSSDAKPAVDDKRDGRAAAGAMPTGQSLGQRQLQKRAVVGGAGDEAERRADQAADHVMRMAEPGKPAESAPTAPPSPPAAAGAEPPVRRVADPATEQKVPGTPTVKPVGAGSAGGAGPDTATPAGPAPLVAPPIAAGAKPAESGTPAPDPEPPAPEGEPPARDTPAVPLLPFRRLRPHDACRQAPPRPRTRPRRPAAAGCEPESSAWSGWRRDPAGKGETR